MRIPETLFVASRWAAVIGGVFVSVILMGYLALLAWDRTHQPRIPGWTSIPASPHASHPAPARSHA